MDKSRLERLEAIKHLKNNVDREKMISELTDAVQSLSEIVHKQNITADGLVDEVKANNATTADTLNNFNDRFDDMATKIEDSFGTFEQSLDAQAEVLGGLLVVSDKTNELIGKLKLEVHPPEVNVTTPEPKVIIEHNSLDDYRPSDSDTKSKNEYHLYINRAGEWYIMRVSHSKTDQNYRYIFGDDNPELAWKQREQLKYVRLHKAGF